MPNSLITLNNRSTLVNDFNRLLAKKNNVLFVVLGNSQQHVKLANQAAAEAESSRLAVFVPEPDLLYQRLLQLPKEDGALKPVFNSNNTLYAVAITPDVVICNILTSADPSNITTAFKRAENQNN